MSDAVRISTITEGPTDAIVIGALLDHLGVSYVQSALQPEEDLLGLPQSDVGLGWRDGVKAFCEQEREAIDVALANGIVVVQVDADIARKGKADLDEDLVRPCPPARATCDAVRGVVTTWLGRDEEGLPANLLLCVPADATEAWVVAALFPQEIQKHMRERLSKVTLNVKERLRALGAGAVFECKKEPADLLESKGIGKNIEDYRAQKDAIRSGWTHARGLPEAQRFEADLRTATGVE
jgi:hypothetical protein